MKKEEYSALEAQLGVTFKDSTYITEALTHRSYLNEHKGLKRNHNERIEFLGDAVLELIVTEALFRQFPDEQEGKLTAYRSALVNTVSLAKLATDFGIGKYVLLSRGEAKDTGRARQFILANAMEAILGAIYLDQGYEVAKKFLETHLLPRITEIIEKNLWQDAKSRLQEKAQELENQTPNYQTLEEIGPDHDKRFVVGAYIGETLIYKGSGRSKQEAEQEAALGALKTKGW